MSNVGATVLLVPLAVNIAIGAGANPAVFALTVAHCHLQLFPHPHPSGECPDHGSRQATG